MPYSVDTASLPVNERFDLLNDIYSSQGLVVAPKKSVGRSIANWSRAWRMDSVVFSNAYSQGHIGQPVNPKKYEILSIRRYLTGTSRGWFRNSYMFNKSGDIAVSLYSKMIMYDVQGSEVQVILIPLDMLEIDPYLFQNPMFFVSGTRENLLITAAMDLWQEQLGSLVRQNAPILAKEILALVNDVLGSQEGLRDNDPLFKNIRAKAIRDYIDAHPNIHEISMTQLCTWFGISRATLYREFEEEGGVHAYVNRQRLMNALKRLVQSEPRYGKVSEVAYEFGFDDPFSFSRAFKREFDLTPTDVLSVSSYAK